MTNTTRSPEHQTPGATSTASDMKTPVASDVSPSHEVNISDTPLSTQIYCSYVLMKCLALYACVYTHTHVYIILSKMVINKKLFDMFLSVGPLCFCSVPIV